MINFLIYLLKAGAWLVPFYLLYILVFRRYSFYRLNRIYLLLALGTAFLMPLVNYTIIVKKEITVSRTQPSPVAAVYENLQEPVIQQQPVTESSSAAMGITEWLTLIYFAGAAWMLFRLAKNIFSIYRIIRHAEKEQSGNARLVYAAGKTGHASFFRYILLNARKQDGQDLSLVVEHEKVHVQRCHSADILFCELLKIVQWFNPFVRLYKKSLCELHEFEADEVVTARADKQNYAASLLQMAVTANRPFISQYSRHPLKTRITRLFQPQTSRMKKLLFLLVIPVTVGLLFAFRNLNRKTVPVWVNEPLVVMVDAGHGGSQPGVQTPSVDEKTITLSIAEKIKKHAEAAGIKVLMTRTADADLGVKERVQLVASAKPDIVVSVHVNGTPGKPADNGIECYAGANNAPAFAKTSLQAAGLVMQSLSGLKGIAVNREPKSRNEGIGILKMVACPAMLIECGYLTNTNDFNFITSNDKQDELAKQIVNGLLQYAGKSTTAPAAANGAENDLENEVVPVEAKQPMLYNFRKDGIVILDGKEMSRSLLGDINPALIAHSVYYEADNEVAIKKYGNRAKNGLLRVETKSGKGMYAFTNETEKEKWMVVARASRRMNTVEKYDRFSYTNIDGATAEVLVLAGGAPPKKMPHIMRFIMGGYGGKPIGPVKFVVDRKEVNETEFKKIIEQLPLGGYEIVFPGTVQKKEKGEPGKVEIKRLAANVWTIQGMMDNLLPKKPGAGDGC